MYKLFFFLIFGFGYMWFFSRGKYSAPPKAAVFPPNWADYQLEVSSQSEGDVGSPLLSYQTQSMTVKLPDCLITG